MSNNFWQNYNFRLEPWDTDYDSPINIEESVSDTAVDPNVEGGEWVKRRPNYGPTWAKKPSKIIFIDGRRRLDARFLGRQGNEVLYGAFATIAVGAVLINRINNKINCLAPTIRRAIALGGNCAAPVTHIPCPLGTQTQLTYDLCLTAPDNEAQTPLNLIQTAMLSEEAKLTQQFANESDILVVRDGPLLHQNYKAPEFTLGYVKTMGLAYLADDYGKLLWELELGERTPIFAIGQQGNPNRRWSWYLRSGQPNLNPKRLGYHDLHGLVRLDLYSEVPIARAIEIADISTYLIPQYASHPSRDPRAPQNLTPVGGLEKELGRRMGNKTVIERRLRHFLAQ
jgi:uncharacterized protein